MKKTTDRNSVGGLFVEKSNTLIFRIQFIIIPTRWIFVNVFYMFFVIFAISNNVIVRTGLPNILPVLFVAKPLKRRYKFGKSTVSFNCACPYNAR